MNTRSNIILRIDWMNNGTTITLIINTLIKDSMICFLSIFLVRADKRSPHILERFFNRLYFAAKMLENSFFIYMLMDIDIDIDMDILMSST